MAAWLSRRALSGKTTWLLPSSHIFKSHVNCRKVGRTSSAPGALSSLQDKPQTVEDLHRVTFLETLYRLVFQGYYNREHDLQLYEKQLYGPMYRDLFNSVSVNTPQLLEEVMRNDGTFPTRGDMSLWTEYRDMRGHGYGPFTEEGERWYNLRVVLNKRMLHPRDSAQYSGVINEVVTDFIKRINQLRQASPTGDVVAGISNKLYLFSLESISSILFETRLGCLEKDIPAGTQEFINSVIQMFSNSRAASICPRWSRSLLPFWRRYIDGWEGIFSFAKTLIDKKMEDIQQRVDKSQDVEGEYLTYILSNTQMSIKDVYASITELLLAGVDTTSNTLTWALYQLSKNPEIQDRLYEEVSTLVPADRIPTAAEVTGMLFLRAVVKETLRMYPVVPTNARIITEKPISVSGFQFPKNTSFTFCHYAISHDENTFPESFKFKPERWLRDGRQRPNPFGSIPFGYGVRSCVGRRIAELEMYLVLFRLIRQFEVEPDPTVGELKSINRTVLVPDKKLDLRFVERV
ncbi:sterol 26-hydroxylase, mitochondrial-like isoform X1 [Girardinichthys multiradiatus]|uniref:sterol 26-hydroxylase, mitochondrial-like isoform X1 n=2 Tax=Girardinichthys multiradiatus TaxID=208333 RepID=UPI001FAC7540|nr:sterol 26-hydroxylase, mitochondrial-like isoform X1 [Girardinichthys multiradiatus]